MSLNLKDHLYPEVVHRIQLRMEMGKMSKRQQPDQDLLVFNAANKSCTRIWASAGPLVQICTSLVKQPIITCPRHAESKDNRPKYDRNASQVRSRDVFLRSVHFVYVRNAKIR